MGSLDDRYYGVTGSYLLSSIRKRADITVETITDRDNIKTYKRKWRTVVGVYNDTNPANNGLYTLIRGKSSINISDNDNWEKLVDDGVRIHFASSPPDLNEITKGDKWIDTSTMKYYRCMEFDDGTDVYKYWIETPIGGKGIPGEDGVNEFVDLIDVNIESLTNGKWFKVDNGQIIETDEPIDWTNKPADKSINLAPGQKYKINDSDLAYSHLANEITVSESEPASGIDGDMWVDNS